MCKTNKKAFYKNILQKYFAKTKFKIRRLAANFLEIFYSKFFCYWGATRVGLLGLQCSAGALLRDIVYMPSNRQPLRSEMPAMPAAL
jgi:hypothetical protein